MGSTSSTGAQPPPLPFKEGDTVLDYYHIEEIRGALGSVWYLRASYSFAPQVSYAIQVLPKGEGVSEAMQRDFLSEPERLSHVTCPPYVPIVRHALLASGHAAIIRKHMNTTTLYNIPALDALQVVRAMRAIECIGRALRMAHRAGMAMHGFTHCDVMVDPDRRRASSVAYMLQGPFPIESVCHDMARVHGFLRGYHPPEFLEDPRARICSDVYALGMVSSLLLVGNKHPDFRVDPEAYDFGSLAPFRTPLLRALAQDPSDRFAHIDGFILAAREAARRCMAQISDTRETLSETRVFAQRVVKPDA